MIGKLRIQKHKVTRTKIELTSDQLEEVLLAYFGFVKGDIHWNVSENIIDGVTITHTEELEL